MTYRKKLIEVSLPIEAINLESKKQKSTSAKGHIKTLHYYWARRPLASCRAVLFGMLVDDPGSVPEEFPDIESQEKKRLQLHNLLNKYILWDNSNDKRILHQVRWEIAKSIAREIGISTPNEFDPEHQLGNHFDDSVLNGLIKWLQEHGPTIHDPFCGGGAIPLEAQRLGLRAIGTDLNPLPVLLNKSILEIPSRFNSQMQLSDENSFPIKEGNPGPKGLVQDVEFYGRKLLHNVFNKIGHLYKTVNIDDSMVDRCPYLQKYLGRKLTVISWLWAHSVPSPAPGVKEYTPLISSFILSRKPNREHYIEMTLSGGEIQFDIKKGIPDSKLNDGNRMVIDGKKINATFRCIHSEEAVTGEYVSNCADKGLMKDIPMAIVCEGDRERVYVPFDIDLATEIKSNSEEAVSHYLRIPDAQCNGTFGSNAKGRSYGYQTFSDYFTNKQLAFLCEMGDGIELIRQNIISMSSEQIEYGIFKSHEQVESYANAIATYLALGMSGMADYGSRVCNWHHRNEQIGNTYGRQGISFSWDFVESNPFSNSSGCWIGRLNLICNVISNLPSISGSSSSQLDARLVQQSKSNVIFCTDPPYYNNINYSHLSDFFYVWLKRNIGHIYPELFRTILTPKKNEIIVDKYRGDSHGEEDFLQGMKSAISGMSEAQNFEYPLCFYYAFKQQEGSADGSSSPGWVTFLSAIIESGIQIVGTIPARTERADRLIGKNANKLSTSIVLICRKREEKESIRGTEFIKKIRKELSPAVSTLQESGISPVDLAQAAIGPGMAIFSKYNSVLEVDGSHMGVRRALEIINEELSIILGETDDEIDTDSRVCLRWFNSFGEDARVYGELDSLLKSINASPATIEKSGCMIFSEGKVRIADIESYPASFNPKDAGNAPTWAHVHRLIRLLDVKGESEAAAYMRHIPSHQRDSVRSLTYRLYQICDEKKMMGHAKNYNTLAISWGQVADRSQKSAASTQVTLDEF